MAIYDNPPSIDPNTGRIPDYKQVMVQDTDSDSATYGQYVLKYEYTIGSTEVSNSLLTEVRTDFDQFEGDLGTGSGTGEDDDATEGGDTGDATNIERVTGGNDGGAAARAREEAERQKALAESLSGTYDPEAMAEQAFGESNPLVDLAISQVPIIGGIYAFGRYRTAKELKDNFGIDNKVYGQMQKEMKDNNLTFDQAYSKTKGGSAMTATDDPNYDPYGNIYRSAEGATKGRAFGGGYEAYRDKSIAEERGGFVQGTGEKQTKGGWEKLGEMLGIDKDRSIGFTGESYSPDTSQAEFDRIAQINRDYANAAATGDYSAFGVEQDETDTTTPTSFTDITQSYIDSLPDTSETTSSEAATDTDQTGEATTDTTTPGANYGWNSQNGSSMTESTTSTNSDGTTQNNPSGLQEANNVVNEGTGGSGNYSQNQVNNAQNTINGAVQQGGSDYGMADGVSAVGTGATTNDDGTTSYGGTLSYSGGTVTTGKKKDKDNDKDGPCFLAGTLITMIDETKKPIEEIELMDKVAVGGYVGGIGKFLTDELYDYNGVKVSGSHLVNENNKWMHVKDSKNGKPLGNNTHIVYVLGTEHRKLLIENILFTDYLETKEQKMFIAKGSDYFFNNHGNIGNQIAEENLKTLNAKN